MASHSWVSILRTLFLILLLTPVSTLGHLSNIQTPKGPSLEGRSQQPSKANSLSLETRHNLSQLSASDERTLQREFLLQQFIHRLTTTPHQTILRTQVSWESSDTLYWITFLNQHLRMRPMLACTFVFLRILIERAYLEIAVPDAPPLRRRWTAAPGLRTWVKKSSTAVSTRSSSTSQPLAGTFSSHRPPSSSPIAGTCQFT